VSQYRRILSLEGGDNFFKLASSSLVRLSCSLSGVFLFIESIYGEFIESMKRITFIVLFGAAAVLAGLSLQQQNVVTPNVLDSLEEAEDQKTISVKLIVEGASYELQVVPGSSVYDVMKEARANQIMEFSGKEFPGIGYFVEGINGKQEDLKRRRFWIYYINGQKAKAGISSVFVHNQDIIEWKYEDEI